MAEKSRRLLSPARLVLAGSVAAAAVGVRRTVRSVRQTWRDYAPAPAPAPAPASVPRGLSPRTVAGPGAGARSQTELPARGWKQVLKRAWASGKDHNVSLLAAGVAYYAFLAIFPALIAAVLVYGLVSSPAEVERQVASFGQALPAEAERLLTQQMRSIAAGSEGALGAGVVVAVALALFSASGGMQGLMTALNVVYRERETRNLIKVRGTALLLTLGAIAFFLFSVGLVGVLPVVLDAVQLGNIAEVLVLALRWLGLLLAFPVALAVLFRYGPDRDNPRFSWLGAGALVATVIWLLVSVGFAVYVDNFGSYGKTYGTLAGVVVLLLWLYFSAYAVLFGAEVNAASELQTARDTTEGPSQPMGERGAYVADHVEAHP